MKKAKDRGMQFGKRLALTDDEITELRKKREKGIQIRELVADYGLSKATATDSRHIQIIATL
ncbi:MAG: hypothetical protein ACI92Z_001941 [Paracoccaceae bacterium]|jgi:hypothetical protein